MQDWLDFTVNLNRMKVKCKDRFMNGAKQVLQAIGLKLTDL